MKHRKTLENHFGRPVVIRRVERSEAIYAQILEN